MDLYKLAGLEYGYESKDLWELLNSYPVAQRTFEQGKQIRSYSPVVVFVNHEGAFHYTLKTEGKDYLRFHFHVESESVWDTRCGPPLEKMPWDAFRERPLLLRNGPEELGAAVYVHDPEILPGINDGDPIHVQVTGYPQMIRIIEAPEGGWFVLGDPLEKEDGFTLVLEPGVFWPIGVSYHLVFDQDQRRKTREVLHRTPDLMDDLLFAKILRIETPDLPGDPHLVYVDTQYGELGIFLETASELSKEQRDLLRPGSYLYAELNLDGVAAFGPRENGLIMDQIDCLRAMRTIMKSRCAVNTYSLLPLLAEDVVYYSQYNKKEYHGVREVMMKMKNTLEITTMYNCMVELSEVTKVGRDCPYQCPEGTYCVTIAYGNSDISSLMFLELDEDQLIRSIQVVDYEGYEVRGITPFHNPST